MLVCNAKTRSRPQERRVFLFEQLLVFSEPFDRKSDYTVFIYRHGIKVSISHLLCSLHFVLIDARGLKKNLLLLRFACEMVTQNFQINSKRMMLK